RERPRNRQERPAIVVRRGLVENGVRRRFFNASRLSNAWLNSTRARGRLLLQDAWWYLRNTPVLMAAAAAVVGLYLLLFAGSHIVQGRIFPNVWALGVHIGDMTADEAEVALLKAFNNDVRIRLTDDDRSWTATTAELGLKLDPKPMIEEARSVGMAGIPLGWTVQPV